MSNSGGTLTLPSPTHPHHVDVQAGLRTLRRSLSRSPSKFSLVRTASQSSSDTGSAPSSPSCRRIQSQYFGPSHSTPVQLHSNHTQSPLATPFRPSVKLSLRSAKSASRSPLGASATGSRARTRTSPRTSPRSPSRRALMTASSVGNSTPHHPATTVPYGQENSSAASARSSAQRKSAEKPSNRHSMHLDMSGSSLLNQQPFPEPFPEPSPKKRSDATMDLDESTDNSPKAKRRSYGPLNLGDSFNIFDHFPKPSTPIEIHDDSPREYDWTGHVATSPLDPYSTTQASMPRRAGSLRRSTLQQRHGGDRPSLTRRAGVASLSTLAASPQNSPEASTPNTNRPRLSIDSFTPLASEHSFVEGVHPSTNMPQATQRHPLARITTTSSSGSSLPDDSPTHFPVHNEKPRARMNFSKSLPLGAVRPRPDYPGGPVGSVSTPDYKNARPYEGAFASTGLVSKMIRNPEERLPTTVFGVAVPDTPCKKPLGLPRRPSHGFATYPPPPPSGLGKRGGRFNRHQGSPTTPFGRSSPNDPPRPVLFQGFNSKHSRKGSLFSLYNEGARSPSKNADEMETCDESSMPPTPTKNLSANQSFNSVSGLLGESPTADRFPPLSMPTNPEVTPWRLGNASCKSSSQNEPRDTVSVGVGDLGPEDICHPPTTVGQGSTPSISFSLSCGESMAKRGILPPPSPLETVSKADTKLTTVDAFTKNNAVNIANSLDRFETADNRLPQTPQEGGFTPDGGRPSLPSSGDSFLFPGNNGRGSILPPATPTARQHTYAHSLDRRVITPVHGMSAREPDHVLSKRFGKVEFIGRGEFSEVYKVVGSAKPSTAVNTSFFGTPAPQYTTTPASPPPTKVFAVKKLTMPIQGAKDRKLRMREVDALQSLRGCDHVLQLIDHWEENSSLYIQTEYCEEGNLKEFLSEVGAKGRLDDFRIWKIMFELVQVSWNLSNHCGSCAKNNLGFGTYPRSWVCSSRYEAIERVGWL